jgi:PAS domain S-box-containing protein
MRFRSDPFLSWYRLLRRSQERPLLGYSAAVIAVALATALRALAGGPPGVAPFTTYYLAVVVATVFGGIGPGLLSLGLSAAAAVYFFIAPAPSHLIAHLQNIGPLFLIVAGALVALAAILNEAMERLWRQAKYTAFLLETQPVGAVAVDSHGRITKVNGAIERRLGYDRDELLGRPVEVLVPMPSQSAHAGLRKKYLRRPQPRGMGGGRDLHALHKDGSLIPVEIMLNPFEENGETGVLASIVDVSERKAAEQREQLLAHEIHHRAHNLLMVVQSVARRTVPREHRQKFDDVMAALGRTQTLIAADRAARLRAIVESELTGFSRQVGVTGCDVVLRPEIAQDFTLILHELATNALKYGALSAAAGTVRIAGRRHGATYRFTWTESGGPKVTPPKEAGFGSTILTGVARGFATAVELEYAPTGLRYVLTTELSRIEAREGPP